MRERPCGYGRYLTDPGHVGCPRAASDMSPCIARDGATALADDGLCVGCRRAPDTLVRELATEYPPAGDVPTIGRRSPGRMADALARHVRQATARDRPAPTDDEMESAIRDGWYRIAAAVGHTMAAPPPRTIRDRGADMEATSTYAAEMLDRVRHRYLTDAEFHARVYTAVLIAEEGRPKTDPGIDREAAMLAAAVALQLADRTHDDEHVGLIVCFSGATPEVVTGVDHEGCYGPHHHIGREAT